MTFFELFLIGIGLSMDAFAVSICKGLSMQKIDKKYTLCIGLFFGGFQALMPLTSGHHIFLSDHEHRPLDRLRPARADRL